MALAGAIIVDTAWVVLGVILALTFVVHRSHREKNMADNIMGRCPECGTAITARISDDHPHALVDSVLAHVCAPAGTPYDEPSEKFYADSDSIHLGSQTPCSPTTPLSTMKDGWAQFDAIVQANPNPYFDDPR